MIGKYQLLGASGIVFMFIILSSLVNLQSGRIPLTLILIFILLLFIDKFNDFIFSYTSRIPVADILEQTREIVRKYTFKNMLMQFYGIDAYYFCSPKLK